MNKEVQEKVLQFGRQLEQDGIPINKLVIFGSYAKNNATKDSDIDVCVVSPIFGRDSIDELNLLSNESRKIDTRIEAYPASPAYYEQLESPLIWEIRKYGLEVYSI